MPPSGKFKFNLDGSSFGNTAPAGYGGILIDDKGDLVFGFSHSLGIASNSV